jgi:putative lipoprotein
MTGLNRKIRVLFSLLLLSLCQISHAENKSEASLLNENEKRDSSKTSDKWLAPDKLEHFGVSAYLSALCYEIYHDFYNNGEKSSVYFSCGLTFSLGLGKEIYDQRRPDGKFSYKDLAADFLGIVAGLWIATR